MFYKYVKNIYLWIFYDLKEFNLYIYVKKWYVLYAFISMCQVYALLHLRIIYNINQKNVMLWNKYFLTVIN